MSHSSKRNFTLALSKQGITKTLDLSEGNTTSLDIEVRIDTSQIIYTPTLKIGKIIDSKLGDIKPYETIIDIKDLVVYRFTIQNSSE
jgi:hypothetical protein